MIGFIRWWLHLAVALVIAHFLLIFWPGKYFHVPPPKVRGYILVSDPIGVCVGVGSGVGVGMTYSCTHDISGTSNVIPPNLHGYVIGTSLRADKILVTFARFSRSQAVLNI